MKKRFALSLAGAVALAATAVPTAASAQTDPSIAEIAQSVGYTTLLSAVTAAGLDDELADCSYGPVTVFAPSNEAFAELDPELLTAALGDPDGLLTSVLQYHVVPGTLLAADVTSQTSLTTALGQDISVNGTVLNGSVNITSTDNIACNGVVHTIDSVLLPTLPSIAEVATANGFNTLLAAVTAAGLAETLSTCPAEQPLTVFAPTDAAFAAALQALGLTAEELLGNTELLTTVLTYHVVPGLLGANEVLGSGSLTTLQGEAIEVAETGAVLNGNVNIVGTDNWACNGVVHVIDAVLLPPSLIEPAPTTTAPATTTPATELPATGNENVVMVTIASVLLLAGIALVITRRRSMV